MTMKSSRHIPVSLGQMSTGALKKAPAVPYASDTAADRAPGSVSGAWRAASDPPPAEPVSQRESSTLSAPEHESSALPAPEHKSSALPAPEPFITPGHEPGRWNLDSLAGRFLEISSNGQTVAITAAASLILEAQHGGEPAAWIAVGNSTFFPPDFAECGIDLESLPVVRVPHALSASRAADQLLRSGGFGVIVLDLGSDIDMRIAVNARLAALAKKHRTVLVCLTQKEPAAPSLGPLVSLRVQGVMRRTGFNHFTWSLDILKDKLRGLGWNHAEVCRGPDGLC